MRFFVRTTSILIVCVFQWLFDVKNDGCAPSFLSRCKVLWGMLYCRILCVGCAVCAVFSFYCIACACMVYARVRIHARKTAYITRLLLVFAA